MSKKFNTRSVYWATLSLRVAYKLMMNQPSDGSV